jgi:hypothetical protein
LLFAIKLNFYRLLNRVILLVEALQFCCLLCPRAISLLYPMLETLDRSILLHLITFKALHRLAQSSFYIHTSSSPGNALRLIFNKSCFKFIVYIRLEERICVSQINELLERKPSFVSSPSTPSGGTLLQASSPSYLQFLEQRGYVLRDLTTLA